MKSVNGVNGRSDGLNGLIEYLSDQRVKVQVYDFCMLPVLILPLSHAIS